MYFNIDDKVTQMQKGSQFIFLVVGCQVVRDFKGDERFQCDQCELKFSYYAALLRHLDARHKTFDANQKIQEVNKKAVNCEKCGATLSSKGALHGRHIVEDCMVGILLRIAW